MAKPFYADDLDYISTTLTQFVLDSLENQREKGFITGAQYANCYLGLMQTLITTCSEIALNTQKAELELDALKKQIVKIQAETNSINKSVVHNAAVKATDATGSMLGSMCMGGIVAPSKMFDVYFSGAKYLFGEAGINTSGLNTQATADEFVKK